MFTFRSIANCHQLKCNSFQPNCPTKTMYVIHWCANVRSWNDPARSRQSMQSDRAISMQEWTNERTKEVILRTILSDASDWLPYLQSC